VHLAQQVTRFPTVLEQQLQLQQVALSGQLFEYQAALQAVQEDAQLHNERCEQLRSQVDKMENKLDDQKAAARRERVQARAQADAKEARSTMLQHEIDDMRRQCSVHQMEEAALQDRLFSLQSEKTDFLMMSETNRSSEVDQIRALLSTASERESSLLHQLSTLQMESSFKDRDQQGCIAELVRLLSASKIRVLDLCADNCDEMTAPTNHIFDENVAPSTSQLLDAATNDFEQICDLLNQHQCS